MLMIRNQRHYVKRFTFVSPSAVFAALLCRFAGAQLFYALLAHKVDDRAETGALFFFLDAVFGLNHRVDFVKVILF
jgi:hypothetical protein